MLERCNRRQFLTMLGSTGVRAFVNNVPGVSRLQDSDGYLREWAPPGVNLKDHTFFWDQASGTFYFSSIRFTSQEGEVSFAYARSRNLCEMEDLGAVLNQRSADGWESSCIWAPHLFKQDDTYYMFFTGVKHFFCQSILVATTTDPSQPASWQISKDWFFQPTHPGADWRGAGYWSDCRDPMVYRWEDRYLLYYTGRDIDGHIIGVASAANLYGPWSDPVPLFPGWAHEFFTDQNGKIWCSYLTSYTITVQPVTMDHTFTPPRIFLGNLNRTFLPIISE